MNNEQSMPKVTKDFIFNAYYKSLGDGYKGRDAQLCTSVTNNYYKAVQELKSGTFLNASNGNRYEITTDGEKFTLFCTSTAQKERYTKTMSIEDLVNIILGVSPEADFLNLTWSKKFTFKKPNRTRRTPREISLNKEFSKMVEQATKYILPKTIQSINQNS